MAIDWLVVSSIVANIFAGCGLFATCWAIIENNKTRQLKLFSDSFKDIHDVERLLYTDRNITKKAKTRKNWLSLFFNSLERFAFLANEKFLNDKRLVGFFKDAIITWYEQVFIKHSSQEEREARTFYPQFKKLYRKMKYPSICQNRCRAK